ncbi:nucleotide pyrophosphohydrolase [Streptococcus sp. 19428wA2_WM07]|nr:nucleotide pyrophosphohydrolase [Streptococcus sp. 19428wA2_WM07]TFU28695.1 nucleotide pyrophosphohydrolase [Streptococcus sp. WM07]
MENILQDILKFRKERGWGEAHSPRNLATSIIIEAAELLENYQWGEDDFDPINVQEEIADILIYTFQLTDKLGLDVETVIQDKLKKNALKYPVTKEED